MKTHDVIQNQKK